MAIYVIGDVQGCFDELLALIDYIPFKLKKDQLWFVGDLVSRGPKSLETLRWVKSLGDTAVTVLGNHDLHLLAAYVGAKKINSSSSLSHVLEADDADELIDWLRHQALMQYCKKQDFAMLHAGLPPQWNIQDALHYANEVETVLRSKKYDDFLYNMYGDKPDRWDSKLKGWNRLRIITNFFTRLRYCTSKGVMSFTDKGPPGTQSTGMKPWYEIKTRNSKDTTIVFGHWSTLGYHNKNNVIATDTGCIWGGALTAVRIDDNKQKIFQIECEAKHAIPDSS